MEWVQSGNDPPPSNGVGTLLNLGLFLKLDDPLKILQIKLNITNIGTKSINMSNIMVYFAMFSTTNDKILGFFCPHKMKMSHHFSVLDTLWNLGLY